MIRNYMGLDGDGAGEGISLYTRDCILAQKLKTIAVWERE